MFNVEIKLKVWFLSSFSCNLWHHYLFSLSIKRERERERLPVTNCNTASLWLLVSESTKESKHMKKKWINRHCSYVWKQKTSYLKIKARMACRYEYVLSCYDYQFIIIVPIKLLISWSSETIYVK